MGNRDRLEQFTEFLGHGNRVGLVPIGGGHLYVWTTFNSPRESRAWALESVGALQTLFGEFRDARVRGAFAGLEAIDSVVCTDIEEVHQAAWARGRVALLGERAPALTPNSGELTRRPQACVSSGLARSDPRTPDAQRPVASLAPIGGHDRPDVRVPELSGKRLGLPRELAPACQARLHPV